MAGSLIRAMLNFTDTLEMRPSFLKEKNPVSLSVYISKAQIIEKSICLRRDCF